MPSGTPRATKSSVAAQLVTLIVAAAIVIPAVTPFEAVSGAPWIKILFLSRMVALVTLAYWMLRRKSLRWSDVGLNRPNGWRFLIALAAGLLMTISFVAAAQVVIARLGLSAPNYSAFAPIRGNFGEYLFWVIPVALGTAAFGEELLFRGFITDALRRLFGGSRPSTLLAATTAQAGLFGILHFYQGPGGIIVAGVTGLALGLTWLIAGRNLWPGIIVHALLDGSAMTAIYLGYVAT